MIHNPAVVHNADRIEILSWSFIGGYEGCGIWEGS
jgi:hypothetical protein